MRLLVTRPEPDATHTVQALCTRGHDVLVAPLLRTQTIEADLDGPGPCDAVLMTSANAARALATHPRAGTLTRLPAFTVGARSAEAARAAGFADVTSADGALSDLVRLVAPRFAGCSLLYLAGEDRAGDLAGDLGRRGVTVETAVIYRAIPAERLPDDLKRALADAQLDGALHYSRRSVTTLIELGRPAGVLHAVLDLAHYCLSGEVAAPLRNAGARQISVAPRPDEAALIGLL
jgi:uroporphyrinogen-III synthase